MSTYSLRTNLAEAVSRAGLTKLDAAENRTKVYIE